MPLLHTRSLVTGANVTIWSSLSGARICSSQLALIDSSTSDKPEKWWLLGDRPWGHFWLNSHFPYDAASHPDDVTKEVFRERRREVSQQP